jgi:AraC family transcriptional regulator of adaptative response/methylated-DNA-[protein]-cysteine methyltransferase
MANPKNVTIYSSLAAARASGFRACKRCHPDDAVKDAANVGRVALACRLMDESENVLPLARLASAVNLSPSYFHRLFKASTGVTPRAYATARKAARVREYLAQGQSVTEALYEAGFNSSGRFYEQAAEILGMTPGKYRAGGLDENIRFAVGQSSLGAVLVASSARGVAAILIGDDPDVLVRDLQDRFPRARLIGADTDYGRVVATVIGMVEAPGFALDLPLDIRGTAFQQRVWSALRDIPAGRTVSYLDIAQAIGAPNAVRAVEAAIKLDNPTKRG